MVAAQHIPSEAATRWNCSVAAWSTGVSHAWVMHAADLAHSEPRDRRDSMTSPQWHEATRRQNSSLYKIKSPTS
jgi:hypothetical protein